MKCVRVCGGGGGGGVGVGGGVIQSLKNSQSATAKIQRLSHIHVFYNNNIEYMG